MDFIIMNANGRNVYSPDDDSDEDKAISGAEDVGSKQHEFLCWLVLCLSLQATLFGRTI